MGATPMTTEAGDYVPTALGEIVEHRLEHLPFRHQLVDEEQRRARADLPREEIAAHDLRALAGAKKGEGNTLRR